MRKQTSIKMSITLAVDTVHSAMMRISTIGYTKTAWLRWWAALTVSQKHWAQDVAADAASETLWDRYQTNIASKCVCSIAPHYVVTSLDLSGLAAERKRTVFGSVGYFVCGSYDAVQLLQNLALVFFDVIQEIAVYSLVAASVLDYREFATIPDFAPQQFQLYDVPVAWKLSELASHYYVKRRF